ncbi:transposase [Gluconacetobacter sp. Hr-1-5]|uniref:transposase n=1 Tax=Gluconacetobacter sp. Hr-1-5 TaxID=3395370 RepID=UPI003B52217E
MRQKILIGVERRRRWSDNQKMRVLSEVGVDGATVSDVGRHHDPTRQHLYQWRLWLRQCSPAGGRGVRFLPLERVDKKTVPSGPCDVTSPDRGNLAAQWPVDRR